MRQEMGKLKAEVRRDGGAAKWDFLRPATAYYSGGSHFTLKFKISFASSEELILTR
jgi:hypothetical protein